MINYKDRTNAQLFYAQSLIGVLEDSESEINSTRESALLQSAWLSLKEGLLCWLNELAQLHQYKGADLISWQVLLESGSCTNPEFERLINLNKDPHSWLGVLNSMTLIPGQALEFVTERPSKSQNKSGANLITAVEIGESFCDKADNIKSVLAQFKCYIDSVREQHTEW